MRQHGAERSEAPKRQRSPQHADPSAARDTPKKYKKYSSYLAHSKLSLFKHNRHIITNTSKLDTSKTVIISRYFWWLCEK
ncbi:MAG: hypothetical protein NZ455_00690 [Bacteroidia bacterium]|nr:hypothetical protein [Bacteroidia bacterium]